MFANLLVVWKPNGGLNKGPLNDQTVFDDLNTEQFRFSDPHCSLTGLHRSPETVHVNSQKANLC